MFCKFWHGMNGIFILISASYRQVVNYISLNSSST